MVIVVMVYGGNMKGSKITKANDWIVAKFNTLLATIEAKNPNIDDFNLRWVEAKLEDYKGGIVPEREELERANKIWLQWKQGFAPLLKIGIHNGQGLGIQMLFPITTGFG